ncbi:peptidoglycan-binding protein [Streptomyces sp. NPDC059002]|uniref:peptidoglycan-binding domain-containing protein n=1 Tax=Streptomyces sp. NPDC059002 TaxID=3346690 RepID=UPI00368786C9
MRNRVAIGVLTALLAGGGALTLGPGAAASSADTGEAKNSVQVQAPGTCVYYSNFGNWCGYYSGTAEIGYGSPNHLAVKEIQSLINQKTYWIWTGHKRLKVDGQFGDNTRKAVKWFQSIARVKPYDGIVGKKTWGAFRASPL